MIMQDRGLVSDYKIKIILRTELYIVYKSETNIDNFYVFLEFEKE